MHWRSGTPADKFVVSVYGADSVDFDDRSGQYPVNTVAFFAVKYMVESDPDDHERWGITQANNDASPEVYTYDLTTDFKFLVKYIVNQYEASSYQLTMKFPKMDGIKLIDPEHGDGYSVNVPAGEKKVILARCDIPGHSYSTS